MEINESGLNFVVAIQNEIKRISPSISLGFSKTNPLGQVLGIVKIAVDTLISEKKILESQAYEINTLRSFKQSSAEMSEIIEANNKLRIAHEKLLKYEASLLKKEQDLEGKENEIKSFLARFNVEKEILQKNKEELSENIKKIKEKARKLKEREAKILAQKQFSDENNRDSPQEKGFESSQENEVIKRMLLKKQQELENEALKLEAYRNSLEIKEKNLKSAQRDTELIQHELEIRQVSQNETQKTLEKEKKYLIEQKKIVENSIKASSEELLQLELAKTKVESKVFELKSSTNSNKIPNEIPVLFEELVKQIEVFNDEMTKKEFLLGEREKRVKTDQEKITQHYFYIKQIEESLQRSKTEIVSFYYDTVRDLENSIENLALLSKNLTEKIREAEEIQSKLSQDPIYSAINYRYEGTDIKEKIVEKTTTVTETAVNESRPISSLSDDISAQVKKLKRKESELNRKQREQKVQTERIIKMQEELTREIQYAEKEKEKIRIQAFQLESAIKVLGEKENEIKIYKQELDKQSNLLSIKENQLELKLLRIRSTY